MASRADISRCAASRASHQPDDIAAVTTNSGTSCALVLACANTFPPPHGAFTTCAGQPSLSVCWKLLERGLPQPGNLLLRTGSKADRTDPERLGRWWEGNQHRFSAGTAYFRGSSKVSTNWFAALSEAPQRQRWTAALELALRRPENPMFEVRGRGDRQQRLLRRAAGPDADHRPKASVPPRRLASN